jgi:quercetin dioxygenase-like cupin family protein
MADFPAFMKSPANRIAPASQHTSGIEGYVFDGADGSQLAFWTCSEDRVSDEHVHDFDEYVLVVEGRVTLTTAESERELRAGDEVLIPRGTRQRMAVVAGTRTLHAFGGRRARRASG